LLCRDYKGKEADRLVTRIDPGVVLLVAELRARPVRVTSRPSYILPAKSKTGKSCIFSAFHKHFPCLTPWSP
jgi:hypothetical protein